MNTGVQLYEVSSLIRDLFEREESFDAETGELTPEAEAKIKALEMGKEMLQKNLVEYYKEVKAFGKVISDEKERLSTMERANKNKEERIKNILAESLNGEKAKIGTHSVYYMTSTAVETDPVFFSARQLFLSNPELVKVNYELKKDEVKKLWKSTGTLPENVIVKENKNLVIR